MLLTENKDLNKDAERDSGIIKLCSKQLNGTTKSLPDEKKKAKEQALAQLLLAFLYWVLFMIEDSGMRRSGWTSKCTKMDKENKAAFVKREQKRKTIKEAEEFAKIIQETFL